MAEKDKDATKDEKAEKAPTPKHKGKIRIEWLETRATRGKGFVETWASHDDTVQEWEEKGWVRVTASGDKEVAAAEAEAARAKARKASGLSTKDFETGQPENRSMKGKGERKDGE